MSDQHTPGPWMVVKEPNLWSICGDRQNEVALLLKHKPNADANARLIAAAPEMLAVLILARKRLACAGFCECAASSSKQASHEAEYRMEQAVIHARIDAVIAKATGNAAEPV